MKFKFQPDSEETQSTSLSKFQTASLQKPSIYENPSKKPSEQIKNYLSQVLDNFQNQIDSELKTQQLLKTQIQLLSCSIHPSNSFSSNSIQTNLSPKKCIQANTDPNPNVQKPTNQLLSSSHLNNSSQKPHISAENSLNKQTLTTLKQKNQQTRSIKSQLLTKGYPATHKIPSTQSFSSNKTKLPYRFNFKT